MTTLPRTTLIDATELRALLADGVPVVLLDCGFDLAAPQAGRQAHAEGHIPGAVYAHLDEDLAGPKTGRNGRHPLPDRAAFAATVGQWGVTADSLVVAYDHQGGPYAARAWWLLRWLGHQAVAVLDGGASAWRAAGGDWVTQAQDGPVVSAQAIYPAAADPAMPTVNADELLGQLGRLSLLDARAAERFRGEVEPLDPVAGHIPGATCRFFKDNLQADGRFKPAEQLRTEFAALGVQGEQTVQQCGSGVTACHNLLAMAHAGLGISRLYPGSWSEWCSEPARPVARG